MINQQESLLAQNPHLESLRIITLYIGQTLMLSHLSGTINTRIGECYSETTSAIQICIAKKILLDLIFQLYLKTHKTYSWRNSKTNFTISKRSKYYHNIY